MRKPMPNRRRNWTQRVTIGGQAVYLCVGEYPDGGPGEVFLDASKQGTFLRGILDALARMISISLQCGAGIDVVVHSLKGLKYPPNGTVEGTTTIQEVDSVTDWIAAELEARYGHATAVVGA